MRPTATACYLRVSSRQSTGRQTTDSQRHALQTYCSQQHIRPQWYEDYATGRTTRRPSLQRLLSDCQDGKVSRIIVTDLSRLSRSVRDALCLIETLTAQGVALTVVNQGLTFDRSAMSAFMLTVFSALAQLESDIRSERVRNGLQVRRDKGLPLGRARDLAKRQQVATLRRQGLSVQQVAQALGVSRQSIYRLQSA